MPVWASKAVLAPGCCRVVPGQFPVCPPLIPRPPSRSYSPVPNALRRLSMQYVGLPAGQQTGAAETSS